MGKSRSSSKPNTQHTCKFISFSFLRSSIILLYFLENEEKADSIPRSQRPFISAFISRRFLFSVLFCSVLFSSFFVMILYFWTCWWFSNSNSITISICFGGLSRWMNGRLAIRRKDQRSIRREEQEEIRISIWLSDTKKAEPIKEIGTKHKHCTAWSGSEGFNARGIHY